MTLARWCLPLLTAALLASAVGAQEVTGQAPPVSCDQQPYSIQLTVANIKNARGVINIELYDDVPEHFLHGHLSLTRVRVPAEKGHIVVCIPAAKPGGYAIAAYHDENANTKFDKTWIGLPAEPYGVSNNPPIQMRAPRVDEALFQVNGQLVPVNVTLHN